MDSISVFFSAVEIEKIEDTYCNPSKNTSTGLDG